MSDRKATSTIKEWNDRAEKFVVSAKEIREASESLSEVAKAADAAKAMGKYAGALGVASVGIDIVLSFMDKGPSDTELILRAIEKLSGKVSSFWDSVDTRLDKLEAINNFNSSQAPIKNVKDDIKQLTDRLGEYNTAVENKLADDAQTALDLIYRDFNPNKLGKIMDTLADQAVMPLDTTNPQYDHVRNGKSILAATYDLTLGNVGEIATTLVNMIDAYTKALYAAGLWYSIEWQKQHDGQSIPNDEKKYHLKEINNEHGAGFEALCACFEEWVHLCEKHVSSNIEKRLARIYTEVDVSTGSELECRAVAQAVVDKLEENFDWMAFSVVIYEPMTNWKYHGWTGSSYIQSMQQVFRNKAKANVMVWYGDKEKPSISEVPENYDLFLNITNAITRDYDLPDVTSTLNYKQTIRYRGAVDYVNGAFSINIPEKNYYTEIANPFLLPHKFCAHGVVMHIDPHRNASVVSSQGPGFTIPNWWSENSRFKYFYLG